MTKKIKEFIDKYQDKFTSKEELGDLTQALKECDNVDKNFDDLNKANSSLRHEIIDMVKNTGTKEEKQTHEDDKEPRTLEEIATAMTEKK